MNMAENLVEKDLPPPKANKHVFEESAETYINTTKIHYTWTIRDFRLCFMNVKNQEMKSPTFPGGAKDRYNWQLILNIDKQQKEFWLDLYFLPGEKSEAYANCEVNILNDKKPKHFEPLWEKIFCTYNKQNSLSAQEMIPRGWLYNDTNGLLPNDVLTIVCDIVILEDVNTVKKPYPEVSEVTACQQRLLHDISHLYESPELCDVTLIACDGKIQAHKAILAARSPVFANMFKNMKEKHENEVDITSVNYDVLREMLRYVYTGKIGNLDKIADDLLIAADEYKLLAIKDQCEQALCKSITAKNVTSLLQLCAAHNAVHLKEKCLNFSRAEEKNIQRKC